MKDIAFRMAERDDARPIRSLLKRSDLPCEDIDLNEQDFIVAVQGPEIVGIVGLEAAGKYGLLRSLAVEASSRNKGLGKALLDKMITHAERRGVKELYLLTTTADKFFAKHGFEKAARSAAPAVLQETHEFRSICPVSAVCMNKKIR